MIDPLNLEKNQTEIKRKRKC